MDIKYDVAITSIGNLARTFLTNNNSAILLDEGIRPNLSDMVLEHTPGKLEEDIKKGDKLLMGGIKYTIEKVGDAVNENFSRRNKYQKLGTAEAQSFFHTPWQDYDLPSTKLFLACNVNRIPEY